MSKTLFTTKANSVFLATVLVAGIIALSYPSFMVGAQAQQFNGMDQRYNSYEPEYGQDNRYNSYEPEYGTDYGMDSYGDKQSYGKDNSYDKSKDSVIVKKIKCNNINVNLNGLEINTLPPTTLNGLATEAQADEGETGANSFGSDGRGGDDRSSGHDSNSRFVCINNNNNGQEKEDEDGAAEPEEPDCGAGVACFTSNEEISESELNIGIKERTLGLEAGATDAEFCEALQMTTRAVLEQGLRDNGVFNPATADSDIAALFDCLIAAGFTNFEA